MTERTLYRRPDDLVWFNRNCDPAILAEVAEITAASPLVAPCEPLEISPMQLLYLSEMSDAAQRQTARNIIEEQLTIREAPADYLRESKAKHRANVAAYQEPVTRKHLCRMRTLVIALLILGTWTAVVGVVWAAIWIGEKMGGL